MMMTMRKRAALAVGLLALAGCATTPQVVREGSYNKQIASFYVYGAGGRDLRLEVRGNPFPQPKATLDQAVEQGLAGGGMLQPPTHPRLSPDASARRGYTLVVDFSSEADSPPLCELSPPSAVAAPVPAGRNIDLEAAFCVAGQPVSQVHGRVVATGPADPAFQALLHQIGDELFRPDLALSTGTR